MWTAHGQRMREGKQLVRDFIAIDPALSYIDVFTPMLGADGVPRPELFISDREHMTPSGCALWTRLVKPHLK